MIPPTDVTITLTSLQKLAEEIAEGFSDCQIASSMFFGEDSIAPGCSSSPMKACKECSQFLLPFDTGILHRRGSENCTVEVTDSALF